MKGSSLFLTLLGDFDIYLSTERPSRIEYPGAYYHVMNRGLTGQRGFVSEFDFMGFSAFIEDAWRRWDIRVFSYCLMDTHYYVALQTPHGNLQRIIMRHIRDLTNVFYRATKKYFWSFIRARGVLPYEVMMNSSHGLTEAGFL